MTGAAGFPGATLSGSRDLARVAWAGKAGRPRRHRNQQDPHQVQHDEPIAPPGAKAAGHAMDHAAAALARWERSGPGRILHVFSLEKFVGPFIDFVDARWPDNGRHLFICVGDVRRFPLRPRRNVIVLPRSTQWRAFARLAHALRGADKVLLHGLFDQGLVAALALQPWVLRKCYWVIWGGDLYMRQSVQRTWKWRVAETFRGFVIRRLGHLVTHVEGDVALARTWYGARGGYRECLMYPSNLFKEAAPGARPDGLLNVQVGNSADPGNGHFEMLDLLAASPGAGGMRVYAPLSYGDAANARAVAERGRALFGDRFVPLLDFMPLPAYVAWLESIDIALFNHKRQQGMGNAVTLLGMGKKVHMRTDVSQWEMFRRLGLAIFPLDAFVPERLPAADAARNREIVRREFSEDRLQAQLSRIFEE